MVDIALLSIVTVGHIESKLLRFLRLKGPLDDNFASSLVDLHDFGVALGLLLFVKWAATNRYFDGFVLFRYDAFLCGSSAFRFTFNHICLLACFLGAIKSSKFKFIINIYI